MTDSYARSWGVKPYDTRITVIDINKDKYKTAECRVYQSRNAAMNQARKWLKMYNF